MKKRVNQVASKFLLSVVVVGTFAQTATYLPNVCLAFADENTEESTQTSETSTQNLDEAKKKVQEATKKSSQKVVSQLDKKIYAQLKAKKASMTLSEFEASGAENQKVRVNVLLKAKSAQELNSTPEPDGTTKTIQEIKEAESDVLDAQESIQDKVEAITGTKVKYSYGYLENGFSIDATKAQITLIQQINGVESVEVANVYKCLDSVANELGNVPGNWNSQVPVSSGNQGEGTVIAVIDTGVDPTQESFRPLTHPEKAKLSKPEVDKFVTANNRGKYFSDKVPYAYNYVDGSSTRVSGGLNGDPDTQHGTHVAGIAAANGDPNKAASYQSVIGVAPEAQILGMKVQSDFSNGLMSEDAMVTAVQDAVALGADVINMSLGTDVGPIGTTVLKETLVQATKEGVIPCIAAGNSSRVSSCGEYDTSQFERQDDDMIGSPGNLKEALTVASCDSQNLIGSGKMSIDGGSSKEIQVGLNTVLSESEHPELQGELVVLKNQSNPTALSVGAESDYQGKDVAGKIAVISRGQLTFTKKCEIAHSHQVKGLLLVDNGQDTSNLSISEISTAEGGIPIVIITKDCYTESIKPLENEGNHTVDFNNFESFKFVDKSSIGQMSKFSSWGPTQELEFKPEITAPGGHVFSTLVGNKYASYSGTSMATPFIAGCEAVLTKELQEKFGRKDGSWVNYAKSLLINSATPLKPTGSDAIFSPRKQGSGLVNLNAALNANAILTDAEDKDALFAEKEVGNKFTLFGRIDAFDKDVSYVVDQSTLKAYTEVIEDGKPVEKEIAGAKLTPSASCVPVGAHYRGQENITIDLSEADIKPGSFVEGIVQLKEGTYENADHVSFVTKEGGNTLNMPFIAYYGNYSSSRNIAMPISKDPGKRIQPPTYLSDGLYDLIGATGTTEDETGILTDLDHLTISPNADGYNEQIVPQLSLTRTLGYLNVDVVDENNNKVYQLYNQKDVARSFMHDNWQFTAFPQMVWGGQQTNENYFVAQGDTTPQDDLSIQELKDAGFNTEIPFKIVSDGTYYIRLRSKSAMTNATEQEDRLKVTVDTVPPKIENLKVTKEADGKYHLQANISDERSGFNAETPLYVKVNDREQYFKLGASSAQKSINLPLEEELATAVQEGKNDFTIAVVDNGGNAQSKETQVTLNPEALTLTGIRKSETIKRSDLKVLPVSGDENHYHYGIYLTGYYQNPKNLAINGVPLNGNGIIINKTGSFSYLVPIDQEQLNSDNNDFHLEVKDTVKDKVIFESTNHIEENAFSKTMIKGVSKAIDLANEDGGTYSMPYEEVDEKSTAETGMLANKGAQTRIYNAMINADKEATPFSADLHNDPTALITRNDIPLETGLNVITAESKVGSEIAKSYGAIFNRKVWQDIEFANVTPKEYSEKDHEVGIDWSQGTFTLRGIAHKKLEYLKVFAHHDPNISDEELASNQVPTENFSAYHEDYHGYDFHYTFNVCKPTDEAVCKYVGYEYKVEGTDKPVQSYFVVTGDKRKPEISLDFDEYALQRETTSSTDTSQNWSDSEKEELGKVAKAVKQYDVYTNKDTIRLNYTLKNPVFSYSFTANNQVLDMYASDAAYGENFGKKTEYHGTYDFPLAKAIEGKGKERFIRLDVTDGSANNSAFLFIHQYKGKSQKPTVTPSTTKVTNHAVNLTATAKDSEKIEYSYFDTQHFNTLPASGVHAINGFPVYFRSIDKYGNKSEAVKYEVKNVFLQALTPTISAKDISRESATKKVTLGFEKNSSPMLQKASTIHYSLNNGKTWKNYSKPFQIKTTTTVCVKTTDLAGNTSLIKKQKIQTVLPGTFVSKPITKKVPVAHSFNIKVKGKATWHTNNSKIATVKNGVVKGVKAGTTVITAKENGKTTYYKVVVQKKHTKLLSKKVTVTQLAKQLKVNVSDLKKWNKVVQNKVTLKAKARIVYYK